MKNYSSKTKATFLRKGTKDGILFLLICTGIALIVLFFGRAIIARVTSIAVMPLYAISHYVQNSSATIPVYLRGRAELDERIKSLQEEITSRQGIATTLTFVEKENAELRALLNASTSAPTVLAGVIARPPYTPYDTVVIDRGGEDGVVSGAVVYYGAGMTLGYVRTVYPQHALVTLFSSPNVETTAYVFGPNIFTTAYGEGDGVMRLSIPQGIAITVGDIVTLPSIEGGVLGTVSAVQSIPTEPEQHAYVTFETPIQSIRLVRVSTEAQSPVTFDTALATIADVEKTLFTVPVPADFRATTTGTSTVIASTTASGTPVQ